MSDNSKSKIESKKYDSVPIRLIKVFPIFTLIGYILYSIVEGNTWIPDWSVEHRSDMALYVLIATVVYIVVYAISVSISKYDEASTRFYLAK